MSRATLILPALAIILAVAFSAFYIVPQTEKVLVLRFGQINSIRTEPGLYFKVPLVDEVVRYDSRILGRDIEPLEVTPSDDRRLVVDAFARYQITDIEKFRQAVGGGGIEFAENRIDAILGAQIREVLGKVDSSAILSEGRSALAAEVLKVAKAEALSLGVTIVDVRLRRTDLPPQNLDATFARMRAEREREAADQIARGNEAAQRLRATADRTVIETVSDAKRQSEILRGEADAKRTAIFAEAYGADPEFFRFYRSLDAYRTALKGTNSTMVLSPDSPFFDYLQSADGRKTGAAPAP